MKEPKKRVGRPRTGIKPLVAIRWPSKVLDELDAYAKRQKLARPEAMREIVANFLAAEARRLKRKRKAAA